MTIEYNFDGERFEYDADDGEIQELIEGYIEKLVSFKDKFGKSLVWDIFELASKSDEFIEDIINANPELEEIIKDHFEGRASSRFENNGRS